MKKIKEEGYLGLKGYFWAERTQQADGGTLLFPFSDKDNTLSLIQMTIYVM